MSGFKSLISASVSDIEQQLGSAPLSKRIHEVDSENVVIGSILHGNHLYQQAAMTLKPADFSSGVNESIFGSWTTAAYANNGKLVTDATMTAGVVSGISRDYLLQMQTNGISDENTFRAHLLSIRNASNLRQLKQLTTELSEATNIVGVSAEDLATEAMKKLQSLMSASADGGDRKAVFSAETITKFVNTLDAIAKGEEATEDEKICIPVGIKCIDEGGGLVVGALNILGAIPGTGKTALIDQISRFVALQHGLPVLMWSQEMSADQIIQRALSAESGIDASIFNKRTMDQGAAAGIFQRATALEDFKSAQYHVIERRRRINQLRGDVMKFKHDIGVYPAVIILDYIQITDLSGHDRDQRYQALGEVSKTLIDIAQEFGICAIGLSQLTVPAGQRPSAQNLRESRDLENSAATITLLHAPAPEVQEVYKRGSHPSYDGRMMKGNRLVEMIFSKNRFGQGGQECSRFLDFEGKYLRFTDLHPDFKAPTVAASTNNEYRPQFTQRKAFQ